MRKVIRYSILSLGIVTVIVLLLLNFFKYLWGSDKVYNSVIVEHLNKSVIYRVDSVDEIEAGYIVCFSDINEEAPTLNATYTVIPRDMQQGGTYRANWLRVTAKMPKVQTYKDLIAMDYTGYVLTDDTIERVEVETIDALVLLYKDHYKPYMRILTTMLWSLEIFVIIFCILVIVQSYADTKKEREENCRE